MRAEELIQRYWIVRDRGLASESRVGVKLDPSESDVLWLDIPRDDKQLSANCVRPQQLADLLLLCREAGRRDAKSNKMTKAAGPWQALIVELKKPGRHQEDAEKAADQVSNLAALVFGGKQWLPLPAMLGVVVYERKTISPREVHRKIELAFKRRVGFPLRFVPIDRENERADLANELKHVQVPDSALLEDCRTKLLPPPAPPPPAAGGNGGRRRPAKK